MKTKEITSKRINSVLDAGTGFMMTQREVIDKMIKEQSETRYNNDPNTDPNNSFALLDTMIEPETNVINEDYTFL